MLDETRVAGLFSARLSLHAFSSQFVAEFLRMRPKIRRDFSRQRHICGLLALYSLKDYIECCAVILYFQI
jgi:hypothetical protein